MNSFYTHKAAQIRLMALQNLDLHEHGVCSYVLGLYCTFARIKCLTREKLINLSPMFYNRKRKRNLESKGTIEKLRAPRRLHLWFDKRSLTTTACSGVRNWQIHSGSSKSSTTPLAKQYSNFGTNSLPLLLIPTDAWTYSFNEF